MKVVETSALGVFVNEDKSALNLYRGETFPDKKYDELAQQLLQGNEKA